jgi:GNAT superfamily N-acetyltransferase
MHEILQDLSPASLARANEANLSSWINALGPLGETRWNDPPGVNRSISPIPFPLFNSIMDTRLRPAKVAPTIRSIKADADARGVPVLWWVGPSTLPAGLGEKLTQAGFTVDEDGRGMAVNLGHLNEKLPRPEGLTIQAVTTDALVEEWSMTLALGFEAPEARQSFVTETWGKLIRLVDQQYLQAFLARLNDHPVATSMLLLGAGVAGIYAVSTIPDARRMGIGAQVTLFPLLKARHEGYIVGILQASEMGYGVYRSIGFEEVCRITSYIYKPKTLLEHVSVAPG